MKSLLTFLIVFFGVSVAFADTSTMLFEHDIYDFGTIKEIGGKVSHTFKFKNIGSAPFVIENISVSCGCTTPEYSLQPVMPNQSREVKITFDPEGRPGEFLKEIYLTSNGGKNKNTIKIKGSILPRPRTLIDSYPLELTSGLRLSTINLNYMYVSANNAVSMVFKVRNFSDKTAVFRAESKASYLKVSDAVSLKEGQSADITVTYDLSKDEPYGMYNNQLELFVNDVKQSFDFNVTAICVDDFSGVSSEQSAKADLSTQFLSLGSLKLGQSITRELTLSNEGASELIIRKLQLPQGVTMNLSEGTKIKPNETFNIIIEFKAEKIGRFRESVVLIFNDVLRPMREIRLMATVQ